jgi:2-dehydropantoate 2-reductase
MMGMKILVVGAGAVGGYFGVRLSLAGHDVAFVARGAHGDAIREHGLTVETPDGALHAAPTTFARIDEAVGFGADLALIAVKARDLDAAAAGIAAALAASGVAIPLLNGLESEARLAEFIGAERVIGGVAQIASEIHAPGRLRVREHGSIVLAPFREKQTELVSRITAELSKAGFACRAARDLRRVLWTKLLWNAPFNAACAITRLDAGSVLAIPELRTVVLAAMREVVDVASAEGVELPGDIIEVTIAATEQRFSATVPSMLQDVLARRPTEAGALQGAVIARARAHGLEVPVHTLFFALLMGIEHSFEEEEGAGGGAGGGAGVPATREIHRG